MANTGPIINTFGDLFETEEEKESAKMDLIEAMDANNGDMQTIHGYPLTVINVAAIDNAGFAEKFLEKIKRKIYGGVVKSVKRRDSAISLLIIS